MTAGFVQPPEWVSFIFSRSPDCHVYICTLNTSPRRWFWMVLESGSAENGHESEQTTCLHGELISIPKTELISRPPHKEHCDQRSRQNHHHPGAVGMCPLLPNQTMGNSQKKKLLISSHGMRSPNLQMILLSKRWRTVPFPASSPGSPESPRIKAKTFCRNETPVMMYLPSPREVELFSDLKEAVLC